MTRQQCKFPMNIQCIVLNGFYIKLSSGNRTITLDMDEELIETLAGMWMHPKGSDTGIRLLVF